MNVIRMLDIYFEIHIYYFAKLNVSYFIVIVLFDSICRVVCLDETHVNPEFICFGRISKRKVRTNP